MALEEPAPGGSAIGAPHPSANDDRLRMSISSGPAMAFVAGEASSSPWRASRRPRSREPRSRQDARPASASGVRTRTTAGAWSTRTRTKRTTGTRGGYRFQEGHGDRQVPPRRSSPAHLGRGIRRHRRYAQRRLRLPGRPELDPLVGTARRISFFLSSTGFSVTNSSCANYFVRFVAHLAPATFTLYGGTGGDIDAGLPSSATRGPGTARNGPRGPS